MTRLRLVRLAQLLVTLALASLVVAEYQDLLPSILVEKGPSPLPILGQGIVGDISIANSPVCYFNRSGPAPASWSSVTGIVYGHGANLTIPISWKLDSCGVQGDFRVSLSPPGIYHFTLSCCKTMTDALGHRQLPMNVDVPPLMIARLDLDIDSGIV